MNTILSLFDFSVQSIGYVFGRLGVELLLCLLAVYLIALVLVQFAKKRQGTISFTNRVKVCFMYGIAVSVTLLGIIAILIIRNNGLHFFDIDSLSWTWYCGYLLMLPEFAILASLIGVYAALDNSIHKSIK